MRHAQTKALHAYWQTRRHGSAVPQRADIEPQDIAQLLGHVFILWRADPQHHIFRLAGTHLCELYQREFRDQNFLSLWRGADRTHIQTVLESAITGAAPAWVVARAAAIGGLQVPIEISFLPLRSADGPVDRILGLFQPLDDVRPLRGRPIVRTALSEIYPPAPPASMFAALQARQIPAAISLANDQ
ncbi:PAS domain-containing protein [Maricaulis sp. CAU 1757]